MDSRQSPDLRVANESDLCRVWAARALPAGALVTTGGAQLQVIYPGRRNGGAGPDFHGALIADASGRVQAGDVEVHLHADDWISHGHRADPAYNNVILHVVLHDDGAACLRADGRPVAVLALAQWVTAPLAQSAIDVSPVQPCRASPTLLTQEVQQIVRDCGRARVTAKADTFEGHIAVLGEEQALFNALLDAAGYSRNRLACAALTQRVPVDRLQSVLMGKLPGRAATLATAILLGLAGLLQPDGDSLMLSLWADYSDLWPLPPLHGDAWVRAGVRPANRPELRLQGIAVLVARTAAAGLAASLLAPLRRGDAAGLIRALEVLPAGGSEGSPHTALIGPGRAADMAINVVVPFALALSTILGDGYLAAATWQTAGDLPPGEESEPIRHMKALLAASGHRMRSACALDTQGLIHLHRSFCSVQACWECPLALGSGSSLTEI